MTNLISANDLAQQLIGAASSVLNKDLTTVQGFAKSQLQKLAEQGAWIIEAEGMGLFKDNPALRKHFLDGIDQLTRNFVATLVGLALTTIEKIWNAMVNIVWSALEKVVGFALPRPVF